MTSDYQTAINQRLDAHYEELIASEKETRPERLEKVRVKLSPDARYVADAEQTEFRRQFFAMVRRDYSNDNPKWNNRQGGRIQDMSD